MPLVELAHEVERLSPSLRRDPIGIPEEQDGVALRAKLDSLVDGREESASPAGLASIGVVLARQQHHEPGEIARFASEAIGQPGAHAGAADDLLPGVHEDLRRSVVELRRVERPHDGDLLHDASEVGQELRKLGAGISVSLEGVRGAQHFGNALDEGESLAFQQRVGTVLSVELLELWLGIEKIEMRRSAGHEEVNDALRLRGKMSPVRPAISLEKTEECCTAAAEPSLPEEVAAGHLSNLVPGAQSTTPWGWAPPGF